VFLLCSFARRAFRAPFGPLAGIAAGLSASNTSQPAGYAKPIEAADKRGATPITQGASICVDRRSSAANDLHFCVARFGVMGFRDAADKVR